MSFVLIETNFYTLPFLTKTKDRFIWENDNTLFAM